VLSNTSFYASCKYNTIHIAALRPLLSDVALRLFALSTNASSWYTHEALLLYIIIGSRLLHSAICICKCSASDKKKSHLDRRVTVLHHSCHLCTAVATAVVTNAAAAAATAAAAAAEQYNS
jgi:hypothetical protein